MMTKTTKTIKGTAKAKYVVEICCQNGNVFLHGPFPSKTKANEYLEEAQLEDWSPDGAHRTNTYKVRMVMHPHKWTKAVK
jgi:DNA transposition AAA+ family ATPase